MLAFLGDFEIVWKFPDGNRFGLMFSTQKWRLRFWFISCFFWLSGCRILAVLGVCRLRTALFVDSGVRDLGKKVFDFFRLDIAGSCRRCNCLLFVLFSISVQTQLRSLSSHGRIGKALSRLHLTSQRKMQGVFALFLLVCS